MRLLPIGARTVAVALAAGLSLVLAACMLSPGKFVSRLDVRKDGAFSFSYAGEVHVLALSKLAELGRSNSAEEPFVARCYQDAGKPDEAVASAERKCGAAEVAEQKKSWDEAQAASRSRRERDGQSMKAMFGGIDPADPKAAGEFAERLRRQAGWRKVEYRGDGLFDVDFALSGRLGHDFTFPLVERFPAANPFVQAIVRADGSLRIDAPGFAPAAAGEPYRGWMQAAMLSEGSRNQPQLPQVDGTFTIVTDAEVLANNTDQGPAAASNGKRLEWTVNARSTAAPMALLRFDR